MSRSFISIALLATCGCSGTFDKHVALDPSASQVQLVTGALTGCQVLGDVLGTASVEGDQAAAMQEARNDIRNHAGAKGATHVALQTNNSDSKIGMWASRVEVTLGGVAYRCGPNGPVITPAPTLTSTQN